MRRNGLVGRSDLLARTSRRRRALVAAEVERAAATMNGREAADFARTVVRRHA